MRYEAWSLPWDSGGFKRKIAKLPVPTGSGRGSKVFLSTAEDGGISLNPDQFDRVGEVISSTVGSLIRVFDGDRIIHEWLAERNAQTNDDNTRELGVSGPGLKAAFDKAFIYAQDYPTNPSLQPNHVWAGETALTDGGMEEANTRNESYEIILDEATGGTFTLTVGGDTTGALAFDATPAQIEAAIEGLASTPDILDVRVDETSDGWNIEFVDPAVLDTNMTWTPSLTGGGGEEDLVVTEEGTDDVPAHWTVSKNPASSSNPKLHGSYASDGLRLTTGAEPVRSGDTALRVNGLSQYSGAQQIVNVEPGARYQASIWVWSSDTTESFKLVMRDQYGRWVAQTIFANTTGSQWEQLTIDFVTELPDGTPVDTLIFRMAQISDKNPIPFYLDDAALKYGAPAANPGEIMGVLMADVQSDHAGDTRGVSLEWVDISSFSDTLDSSGVAWTASHSFEASFGETYGQVLDKLVDLGYEWDLVPKDTPTSLTHDLVIYNEGNLDDDPSTAITVRQGVVGGDVVKRIPSYTAVLVEGSDGRYVEAEDATAVTNFGRIEAFFAARHLADTDSLTQFANQLLSAEAANRTAVRFEVVDTGKHPVPLTTYKPGDTLPMQLPPLLFREERRVQRVDYSNTFPTSYVVTGSRVLRGEAAAFDLVRRLWRRFERPRPKLRSGVSPLQAGFGGGGDPSIVVAAWNASDWSKARADYVCDGIDDHEEIFVALNEVRGQISQGEPAGGRVVCTEGDFYFPAGEMAIGDNDELHGLGPYTTFFHNQDAGAANDVNSYLVRVGTDGSLSNIGFATSFTHPNFPQGPYLGTVILVNYGRVTNVAHVSGNAWNFLWFRGTIEVCNTIASSGTYQDAMIFMDEGWLALDGITALINGNFLRADYGGIGNPTISNVVLDNRFSSPLPGNGLVLQDVSQMSLTNVSMNVQDAGILLDDNSSFFMAISNMWIQGAYGILSLDTFDSILNSVLSNIWIDASVSGIDTWLGDTTIDGLYISGNGTGYGARIRWNGRFQLANFNIIGNFDEDGLVIEKTWTTSVPGVVQVHDGIIRSIDKHGVVLDNINALIHDVDVVQAGLAAANTYDAFHLKGNSKDSHLHDNRIHDPSLFRHGFNVSGPSVERTTIVSNKLGDLDAYGTSAINDEGTATQLTYPADPVVGDNFFIPADVDQAVTINPATASPFIPLIGERESAGTVTPNPPQTATVSAATETEAAQTVAPT